MKVNGVFAGTSNHTGSFPRMEVHVKDGYVKEVKGGGIYGDLWREFLKYPKINELTYPYHDQPGYWWIYEAGMGTNPKFFKRPDENMEGNNSPSAITPESFTGVLVYAWITVPISPWSRKNGWILPNSTAFRTITGGTSIIRCRRTTCGCAGPRTVG